MRTAYKGIEITYNTDGNGCPIVLLHGYLESKEVWKDLTAILCKGYRIIAIDLPGHGDSAILAGTHTMELMAGAVYAVIEKEKCGKVILAGHSLGGYVALAFAELYPERLAGYILFHSHPHSDSPEAIDKRKREIAIVEAGRKNLMYPSNVSMMFAEKNLSRMPGALANMELIASRCPDEGIISVLRGMMARPSRVHVIEEGRIPLLWILGRHDLYFTPEKATGNVRLPGNCKVVIMEDSGHLGFVEEPDHSAAIITEFAGGLQC
ncbi:MAG: alpha/beta hydrolase [Bacteroidales bacterium]|jgi:pimeloyl-ACP methyl ester carboxylesterase|nr:alpha/beta hydrolase [Bacteroidales bacterium]